MPQYFAHISDDGKRKQTVAEHLAGTARLAEEFAGSFEHPDFGYCAGMLHDIGKYSDKFQERIRGAEIRVDHATAGARLCWELGGDYQFLSYCIAGHHAGLPDTGEYSDTGDRPTWMGRKKKPIEDFSAYRDEVMIPELKSPRIQPMKGTVPDFTLAFFIRMLYSCLVDADFLDTEVFMKNGEIGRNAGDPIEVLYGRLEQKISSWMEEKNMDTVNGRRSEILRHCIECGLGRRGLYRMTVPTGGGKTISSLAFALKHAMTNHMDRVIYVIPYTSIIEQNAEVFREKLGAENVLEHHCGVDYEGSEELDPMHLAAENWDKPVIVTTNVQFFESLFANRSSKCRKLHNIANSVIIFDEAQMLPTGYLEPCMAAMRELLKNYKSTLVLCTATQPALEDFLEEEQPVELCPRVQEQFEFFKRTKFRKLDKLDAEELAAKVGAENQALCILNTKKNAKRVYEFMKEDGVYHLSTAMYPAHRKRVLAEVKKRLDDKKRCILIATSLVEAGVDLDFQTVFRQQAGIDSMIQAAGRCNREGKREPETCITYIFEMDGGRVPGQELAIETGRQILERYEDVSSLDAIHDYFRFLYHHTGEGLDKKHIMEQFRNLRFPFAEVGKEFRLIEEDTIAVLIPKENDAKQILWELEHKGISRKLMREAGQYIVNLYENDFKRLYQAGALREITAEKKGVLWVLSDESCYSEKTGITLDMEGGQALFL